MPWNCPGALSVEGNPQCTHGLRAQSMVVSLYVATVICQLQMQCLFFNLKNPSYFPKEMIVDDHDGFLSTLRCGVKGLN